MHLLYIMPAEAFGGAERQGVIHIANLPASGIDVVAVVGPGQPIRTQLERAGVSNYVFFPHFPAIDVEERGVWASVRRPAAYLWSWWKSARKLTAFARQQKIDMVFASRTFGWTVGWAVGRRLGIPVVWRAGSRPATHGEILSLRHVAPLYAPDLLVANCETGRQIYSRAVPAPTVVVRNGVDTLRFSPQRASARLRHTMNLADVPVVGLAARPAPEKGLGYLAEVVALVAREFPTVRFLVAGEFPWRGHFQRSFARSELGERVLFLGHMDDIESFYGSCDVMILTSGDRSIELSSNAIIEAMSAARPVVVTNVGGMAEVVRDGHNGFVAPPDDPELFASRIALLLRRESLRWDFGAAARLDILDCHAQERVTARLATFLQAIQAHKHPGPQLARRPCEQEA